MKAPNKIVANSPHRCGDSPTIHRGAFPAAKIAEIVHNSCLFVGLEESTILVSHHEETPRPDDGTRSGRASQNIRLHGLQTMSPEKIALRSYRPFGSHLSKYACGVYKAVGRAGLIKWHALVTDLTRRSGAWITKIRMVKGAGLPARVGRRRKYWWLRR